MSTADAGGTAHDAKVSAIADELEAHYDANQRAYREALADEAEAGLKAARGHIKSLQASLKTREAEARRLRAEAKENRP